MNKKIIIYSICLIFMFFYFMDLSAEEFHVTNGLEFQDALTEAAGNNHESNIIYMSAGVYYRTDEHGVRYAGFEYIKFYDVRFDEVISSLTIRGEEGTRASDIIIDAHGSGFCLSIDNFGEDYAELDEEINITGITLCNGYEIKWLTGGLDIWSPDFNLIIKDCVIEDNITMFEHGGGASIHGRSIYMENNKVLRNTNIVEESSTNYSGFLGVGGGLLIRFWDGCILKNNIIAFNRAVINTDTDDPWFCAGGIYFLPLYLGDEINLINNTIYGNVGEHVGGISFPGYSSFDDYALKINLYNNIIYNNTANLNHNRGDIYCEEGKNKIYAYHNDYTNFEYTGIIEESVNNLNLDPGLDFASSDDFHLSVDSPMISAGTDSVPVPPGLPDYDFEGDPRIHGAGIDIGADEFMYGIKDIKVNKERIIVMNIISPEADHQDIKKIKMKGFVCNPEYKGKGEIWVLQVTKDGIRYYSKDNKWTDKKSAFYQGKIDEKVEVEINNLNISKSGVYDYYLVVDKEADNKITPDSEASVEEETVIVDNEEQQLKSN